MRRACRLTVRWLGDVHRASEKVGRPSTQECVALKWSVNDFNASVVEQVRLLCVSLALCRSIQSAAKAYTCIIFIVVLLIFHFLRVLKSLTILD